MVLVHSLIYVHLCLFFKFILLSFATCYYVLHKFLIINHEEIMYNLVPNCFDIVSTLQHPVGCLLLQQSCHYYRKQQYVADWESSYNVRYEPRPQVTDSDPLDIQNSFLRKRTEQQIEQTDEDAVQRAPRSHV